MKKKTPKFHSLDNYFFKLNLIIISLANVHSKLLLYSVEGISPITMGKKKWTGPNERRRHNKHKGGHQKRPPHFKHGQDDEPNKKTPFVRHDNKFKGNARDRLALFHPLQNY